MTERFELNINIGSRKDTETAVTRDTPPTTPKERFQEAAPKKEEPSGYNLNLGGAGKAVLAGTAALAISNVGMITGSQATQNKVNNAVKLTAVGIGFAANPIMATVAVAFSIANNALKIANETRMWALAEERSNTRIGAIMEKRGRV